MKPLARGSLAGPRPSGDWSFAAGYGRAGSGLPVEVLMPRPSRCLATALMALVLPLLFSTLASGRDEGPAASKMVATRTGEATYRAACQSCHGPDGRGLPAAIVGFDAPLPDFTDCSFATREADLDWLAVAHDGGPARGFDPLMPAFGGALSRAELLGAIGHIRSFCADNESWPGGALNLPRPLFTGKAFPEDEAVYSMTADTEGSYKILSKLIYETRIGARGQVEVVLPFGFLESEDGDWTGGLGDMVLATKWALLFSNRTGSILSGGLELVLPTGREDRGLGKDTWILEPFLAFGQVLPWEAFIQTHVGLEVSTEPGTLPHEIFWRAVVGMSFFQNSGLGRAFSPMVEVLGAAELGTDEPTQWDLVPQMQVTLSARQHLRLAAGVRLPLTEFEERPLTVAMYLLWDWFDGSLLEGW